MPATPVAKRKHRNPVKWIICGPTLVEDRASRSTQKDAYCEKRSLARVGLRRACKTQSAMETWENYKREWEKRTLPYPGSVKNPGTQDDTKNNTRGLITTMVRFWSCAEDGDVVREQLQVIVPNSGISKPARFA